MYGIYLLTRQLEILYEEMVQVENYRVPYSPQRVLYCTMDEVVS